MPFVLNASHLSKNHIFPGPVPLDRQAFETGLTPAVLYRGDADLQPGPDSSENPGGGAPGTDLCFRCDRRE